MGNSVDRRTFLSLLATASVAGVAPGLARAGSAGASVRSSGDEARRWQETLFRKRRSIRRLYLRFETNCTYPQVDQEPSAAWIRCGLNEFFYTPQQCALICHRGGIRLIEVGSATHFFQKAEDLTGSRSDEVLYNGPLAGRKTPPALLDLFLPRLRNELTVYEGDEPILGELHHVFVQGVTRSWVSPSLETIRLVQHYIAIDKLGERREFAQHFELLDGVYFPAQIQSELFLGWSEPSRIETLEILDAVANQPFVSPPVEFEE